MTNKKVLRIPDYLRHILQAITQVETYMAGVDQTAFFKSPLLQDAVLAQTNL